jgi:hypothetical protein
MVFASSVQAFSDIRLPEYLLKRRGALTLLLGPGSISTRASLTNNIANNSAAFDIRLIAATVSDAMMKRKLWPPPQKLADAVRGIGVHSK